MKINEILKKQPELEIKPEHLLLMIERCLEIKVEQLREQIEECLFELERFENGSIEKKGLF